MENSKNINKMKHLTKFLISVLVVVAIFSSTSCDPDIFKDDNEANKGDTLWVYEIPQNENLIIANNNYFAIGNNGDIYFEARDVDNTVGPRIYAITKDGTFKWKTEPLNNNNIGDKRLYSPIVVGDDGTIFTTCGPYLYAVNPSNGQAQAIWECPSQLTGSDGLDYNAYSPLVNLCLTNDGNLVLQNIGTHLGFVGALFCITPSGQTKWISKRQDPNGYPISIGPDGNIYDGGFLSNWDNNIIVNDPDNGNILWNEPAFPKNNANKITFASNGDVIYPLKQQDIGLSRMRISDKSLIWSVKNQTFYTYNVVDADDNTFADCFSTRIYIPGNASGEITSPDEIFFPLETNIDDKGNLTGRDSDAHPYLISTDIQGNELWKIDYAPIIGASVTIEDDVLYVASAENQKKIYAIQWDASLLHSGWPRYTHDNRNTSNYNKW